MKKMLGLILSLFSATLLAAPGTFHYVGSLQAEVKQSPSENSQTKFIIAIGRKVVEFDKKNSWFLVGVDKTGGKDGWIHKRHLKSSDPDGIRY